MKINLGIIGPGDVCTRRFIPAILRTEKFRLCGIASRRIERAKSFSHNYNVKCYGSYDDLLRDKHIDAVYIPTPNSTHANWAIEALKHGKHILVEKPFVTNASDGETILSLARENKLAVHENFAFLYHPQYLQIQKLLHSGAIGRIENINASFAYPMRLKSDIRYDKRLGGGAFFDAGVYPLKIISLMLGASARVCSSNIQYIDGLDVDIGGTATFENDCGVKATMLYGMNNPYICMLDVTGTTGRIQAHRFFSAPANEEVSVILTKSGASVNMVIPPYDQFQGSLNHFYELILNSDLRETAYESIWRQCCACLMVINYTKNC